jgi:hypothetical protein
MRRFSPTLAALFLAFAVSTSFADTESVFILFGADLRVVLPAAASLKSTLRPEPSSAKLSVGYGSPFTYEKN